MKDFLLFLYVGMLCSGCAFLPRPSADTISVADAEQILEQAETFAQAGDAQGLCSMTSVPRWCERELDAVGGIATAPIESPQIVDSYIQPDEGNVVGYRVLVLEGEDATGTSYRTEFRVLYRDRQLIPPFPVYWSGAEFDD
ncbi:MAG: hypothetical protein GFH27_549289n93 [Chloroflexi bacterium AL-W]|nr:hypothetical protein [Chloroflexi bacterium AL-N1]NOK66825.1 hypothetical protein [Chloroflexi bacterium AL-N10]NOK74883.1 hypothetical protein [Chloroflexi bacterium AL-N5]NOK81428.1 hypothetical protein [Chloroflexi bacterium AL-W]NOK88897.1 hypothetical protein [Chloroflexi bacterium AL-N15]